MAEHLKVWGLFYRWVQRLFSLFDGYYIYRWWFSGYCQCLMVIVIVDGYNGRSHRFVLTCTLLLFFWLHVVFVSLCRRCSKRSRTQKQLGTPCRQGVCLCRARHPACAGCLTYLWRFWEELGSSERQRLWDTLLDSWYSCWIQDFHKRLSILSWLEQYHSWHTLLFHAGSLSSKPHQRIRILQSSVLSAAYPAA